MRYRFHRKAADDLKDYFCLNLVGVKFRCYLHRQFVDVNDKSSSKGVESHIKKTIN